MRSGCVGSMQQRAPCRAAGARARLPAGLGCVRQLAARRVNRKNDSNWFYGRRLVQTVKTATVEAPATAPPPLDTSTPPAAAPAAASSYEQFNWQKSWYPVATLESLKKGEPNALRLLGMQLVAWKPPGSQDWSVLEDVCPHRLAPLSEGIIQNGELLCSYHGWAFNGDGGCTRIPQIGDAKAHATASSSSRACVKRFPSQELFGLLWVWGESSPAAWVESAAAPPRAAPADLVSGEWTPKAPWFQRDVPVSYDTLMENLVDPAHVQFSHHGVIGDRNADAETANDPVNELSCNDGFSLMYRGPVSDRHFELRFTPPAMSRWCFTPQVQMMLYAVPTQAGWTRVFNNMVGPKDSNLTRPPAPNMPRWLNALINLTDGAPWLQHAIQHNMILDGDDYFLHIAERTLYERGDTKSWSKQYYMPSSADAGVIAWRKWLDRHGGDMPLLPRGASDLPPLASKEAMFDRYHQHTENCPHCTWAVQRLNVAIGLLAAVAAIAAGAVVAAVVAGGAPLASRFCAASGAVAAVAAAAAAALFKFRRLFFYYEYKHAEHV